MGGLDALNPAVFTGELESEFVAGPAFLEQLLLFEPILVTAGVPRVQVHFVNAFAVVAEFLDDILILFAVKQTHTNLITEIPGELSDFSGAPTGGGFAG